MHATSTLMIMYTVLLVEDDPATAQLFINQLHTENFRIIWEWDSINVSKRFDEHNIDLCLLDIHLPGKNGFELAEDIRKRRIKIPVLFVTSSEKIEDKVRAFELGADDYICKPVDAKELSVRILNILKRYELRKEIPLSSKIRIGQFTLDPVFRKLTFGQEEPIKLSHIDCELLKLLYQNQHKYLRRDIIIKAIWHEEDDNASKRLSVYINRLRTHLKKDKDISIDNDYGSGYRLVIV